MRAFFFFSPSLFFHKEWKFVQEMHHSLNQTTKRETKCRRKEVRRNEREKNNKLVIKRKKMHKIKEREASRASTILGFGADVSIKCSTSPVIEKIYQMS